MTVKLQLFSCIAQCDVSNQVHTADAVTLNYKGSLGIPGPT
jgi:hypothetical protein